MKPLGDLVLIKENEKAQMTSGGIILPDSVDDSYVYGTVVSIGPGLYTANGVKIPMAVKIGDTVCLNKQTRPKLKMDEEEYLLVRESELLMNSSK